MWDSIEIVSLDNKRRTFLSRWAPRQASNGSLAIELICNTFAGSSVPVEISVLTKNIDEEGSAPGIAVAVFQILSTTQILQCDCIGLRQLVRLQITFEAQAVGQGCIVRPLPSTWYDTAV